MSAVDLPATARLDGETWTVSRAWPVAAGPQPVELRADGRVRGAWWSGGRITADPTGVDPSLPGLADIAGDLVSHRPGKRAVVRADDGFVKVVRPRKAADVVAASAQAAAFGTVFAVPEHAPDREAEARGVVRFSTVAGRTLHGLGADRATTDGDWDAAWRAWHTGWVRTVAADPGDAPVHDAEAEARVAMEWVAHAVRALPERAAALETGAAAVTRGLRRHPSPRLALSHRDLHDKQLLWDGERIGVLDVDTVARAEPELDLANLRVHVDLRLAQRHWSPARADVARRWIDRTADAVEADAARLAAYAAATRLRLGCLYLFRPQWRELALDLLPA